MNKSYAVSDLHGNLKLWDGIKMFLDESDTLYMLGDATDRGPHGWLILQEALKDPRVVYIRGNHDQFILDAWRSDWLDTHLWFWNGGYETYETLMMDGQHEKTLIQLARTKLYHCYVNKEGQRIHLSHAGFTLMENDEIPDKEDLLWDREHIRDRCDWWPVENPTDYVVHGHTFCGSRSCFSYIEAEVNETQTVGRYAHGHKICIDGRSFQYNQCALLDLDTLQETIVLTTTTEMPN